MKKILYLPSWYPDRDNPIIGSFFREQALLAQQHYDVKVLAVQSRELKALRWLRAVLAAGGMSETVDGSDVLPPDCIRYRHLLPKKKYQSAFTWRWQLRLLQRHVAALQQQGWQPDVIHAHSLFGAGLFVEPLARACGAKSVLTEHDSFNLHRLPPFYQQRAIEALKRVDVLAGVSQHLANILSAHGAARRVHVCGNLVDETRFRLRDEPGETFSVLHVSYPDPVKGTELLFEAASLLDPDERAQFRFTIVSGSDRHQQIFRQMADARGVAAQFDIKACVARDDMPAEYTRHACYVSTSYSETFGVAIREAQQAGLPVVTTACGGIDRDVDDSNGVVVPTGDALALRDALRRVRNQRERYDPLQIRETCIARHGRDAFLRKLAALYMQ